MHDYSPTIIRTRLISHWS